MIVTKINNHVQIALGQLLQQYQGRALIQNFYTSFVQQIQDLEDALYPLDEGRQLWNGTTTPAIGAQLDGIGLLVGISRNGLDDQQYILLLFGKIAENFSDDTIQSVLSVINYLFQAQGVLIQEIYPAGLYVAVLSPAIPKSLFTLAVNLVENAIGGGIKLVISSANTTNVFRFAGSGVGPQNGFGSVYSPGSGGVFVGLIE